MKNGQNEKIHIDKQWLRILIRFIQVFLWVVLTACCVYTALYGEHLVIKDAGEVRVTFFIFPYLLLGGLYGYVISFVSFIIAFVITLIANMNEAYNMSIYLVVVTCFSLFAQYYWFKTWKKTILASLITLIFTSIVEYLCFTLVKADMYDWSILGKYLAYPVRDALIVFAVAFFLHLFFTKTPDVFKLPFPIGIAYKEAFQADKEFQRDIRKTRVSAKITAIIIAIELVLGIAVAVFMMVLFPDMKDIFAGRIRSENHFVEEAQEGNVDEMVRGIENMDFRLEASAVTYDIKMILLMLCVGVPLGAFANFFTKITIGEPLGVISDFMYEFANADDDEKLNVAHKVDKIRIKTRDEIGVVYESVHSTVYSIEDYISRLKKEQQLQLDLEVAQKSSEAKSAFLSNMSHEIRTPINAVLGMNEMIMRESTDDQILEYANNVKNAGNSLLSIVNDILDFSKIEAGKMDILPVQYHIDSTINDLVNMVSAKASDKGLDLEINVDKTMPVFLIGDEVRIKQCVTNILSNAVKYTEKGTITLNASYRKIDDSSIMLRFEVLDTGIGIKEEDLDKLFSPFERIEETRNRTIEGTGLGMSIVKKLLAMMGTRLEVKSVYGEGSEFSFELKQQVASWEELGDFKERYKEYLKSLTGYHESFRAPEAKILVVDDTVMNLTVVKGLLKKTQIQIDTAESGRETLEKVQKEKYDVIFIDHRMPEMDGIETLEAMRKLKGNLNVDVPCIALTANAGSGAREEYLQVGFNDYLSKPVNGELLEEMLRQYISAEKIQIVTDDGSDDRGEKDFLDEIKGIDLEEAIKNCGSREVLRDVVEEFSLAIDAKSSAIEEFAAARDYRNYTVAVHALKSSARLIGAMELSGQAAYLEKCGNEENEEEIGAKTGQLVELYRSYKENLAVATKEECPDLPEIPAEELESAFSDIKELVQAYDYDTADGIMKMLGDYSIPADMREKYDKVRKLMADVNRDGLLEIL